MAKLIYSAITSLDGCVEDRRGDFSWAAPDDEVHRFVNELERQVGTYLYGRRMYETMVFWESVPTNVEQSHVGRDYAAIWRAADKVVYSRTLERVSSERTRIERNFDPEAVRDMKARSERDISVGGPELATAAIGAGLVDEYHVFLNPVVVGGGKPAWPGEVLVKMELLDEQRFSGGVVYLRYGAES